MLIGRASECAVLEHVVASVNRPVAASLVVQGPPGIGKSALLDWTVTSSPSFDVLRVDALEEDRNSRWALIRQMVAMVQTDCASLRPSHQDVVAALDDGVADDPIAVGSTLIALLAAAACPRPLLVVVDDAHWADEASRYSLRFIASRIADESIALLLAEETDERRHESLPQL